MANHNETGTNGEDLAVKYFLENDYRIIHRNWRHRNWEIDIIASKDNILHFIEVKTRNSTTYGYPEEDVGKKKIRNLINAADEYLDQYPDWKDIQFDILSILLLKNEDPDFYLLEDVYV